METKATRNAYGEALVKLGEVNENVIVLDADLSAATMTSIFKKSFPERHYNVGIAEANMVGMATGMALMGKTVFCSTFSVFANRCLDQIRNGACYNKANVKFAFSHAGITTGEDGGSHQAVEDIAVMRALPGMTVVVPADALECEKAVFALAELEGPAYLRTARLATPILEDHPFELGKGFVMREGNDAVIFACGYMVNQCLEAANLLHEQGVEITVVDMASIKPIDSALILEMAGKCKHLFSAEEHSVIGGLGDAVAAVLAENGAAVNFKKIGIQDVYGQSGKPAALLSEYKLDAASVAETIRESI